MLDTMPDSGKHPPRRSKILWSLLAVIAGTAALSGQVDDTGQAYADEAFSRALVTFAVARTLNGVISVAQGTEVAVEPGGVGVNFTVGQVLDPINDLVERFSMVMLVATSSLGLQNILLRMTMWWGTSALLVIAALSAVLFLWTRDIDCRRYRPIALQFLLVAVFVRFAVPLLIIGSNLVFDTFLELEQANATLALEATRTEIEQINEGAAAAEIAAADQGVIDRLSAVFNNSINSLNVSARLNDLRDRVSSASEHIVNLIVIFVFQTIILPLVFLWLFAELLKLLASRVTLRR
jgi:hypothetical protein